MFIDANHLEAKKCAVVSAWTNQIIPNVRWVNTELGLCEIVIQDPTGTIIRNNYKLLTTIIQGDFKLNPIKEG